MRQEKRFTLVRACPAPGLRVNTLAGILAVAGLFTLPAQAQTNGAQSEAGKAPVATLPQVTVQGVRLDTSIQQLNEPVDGGALGSKTQLETPFSTTVVTGEELERRQVTKLGDVFTLDAAVSDNSAQDGAWANYLTVRGLQLDWQNGYRIDGKPFLSYVTVLPYEQLERVELLKGASGFMYGFGSPGGIINYVTKRPTNEPVREVSLGYHSDSIFRESADIGGRAGHNDWFGYRLNVTHEEGEGFNKSKLNRNAVSLALNARITEKLTWDMQALYQHRKTKDPEPTIYTGTYVGTDLPSAVRNNEKLVGEGTYVDNEFRYFATGLEYQLAPAWKVRTDFSHATTRTRRAEEVIFLRNQAGDYEDYRSDYGEFYQFNSWQAQVEGQFQTGSVGHDLVAGVAYQDQHTDLAANGIYKPIGTGNLWTQNTNAFYTSGTMDNGLGMYRANTITQKSVYASDTLKFSPEWSLLAGVRYTNYEQRTFTPAGVQSSVYKKNGVLTPTLALMYNFTPTTMAYVSYVESLEPGTIVGNTYANAGVLLDPLKSRQYEIGVKTEQDGWSATAAAFRIEKAAQYTNASNELVQDGESLFQGIELGASTTLGNWFLGGTAMALDTEYKKGVANIGQRVAGAPRFIAAAQLGYNVSQLPGLQLYIDAKYTSSTPLRPSNDITVDSYTLVNVGANYETQIQGYDTTLRLAVNNVFNQKYWMYQYSDYIKAGDPTTVSLSASLRF